MAAADAGVLWPRVVDAIGALPEAERQVLLLFAWEELSYDDIAQALGVPVGTVRSRLSRGRARLAALTRRTTHPRWRWEMTDDLEPLRRSRPDRLLPDDPPTPRS